MNANMRPATPQQNKLVQHRRKMAPIISWVYGIFLISTVLLAQQDVPFVLRVPAMVALYGAVPFAIFMIFWYWRCPVCKRGFSRQSGGKYCENCKTRFED